MKVLIFSSLALGAVVARAPLNQPQNFGMMPSPGMPGPHMGPMGPPPFGMPFGPMGPPPPPPFLKDVDDDAREEFMKIFENDNLSRTQFRAEVKQWAAKQGDKVQKAFADFEAQIEKARGESKKKLEKIVQEIVPALQQVHALYENDALTRKERRKQRHSIIDDLSVETGFAVELIMKMLRPHPPMTMTLGQGAVPAPSAPGMGPAAPLPPSPPFGGFPMPGPPMPGFGPRPPFPPPPPPFLEKVSEEAREEFRKLLANEDLPKSDFKREVELWAEKQGADVKAAVQKFEKKMETGLEEAVQKIATLLQNLPGAFEKMENVVKDETLSRKQTHKKLRQVFDDLDRKEAMIARYILDTYGPRPSLPPPPPPGAPLPLGPIGFHRNMFGRGGRHTIVIPLQDQPRAA